MRSKSKDYQTKSGNIRNKLKNSIDDYHDVDGDAADCDDDDEVVDVELDESDDNSNRRHKSNISGYNNRNNAVNADDINKKRDDDDDDFNSIVQTSLRLFRKLCLYCYRKYFQSVLLLSVGAATGIIITIFYFDYNRTDTSQSHQITLPVPIAINTAAASSSSTSSSSSNDLLSSLSYLPTNILSLTSNISIFDLSVTAGSRTASTSGGIQEVEKKSVVNPIVKLSPTWVASLKKNSNRTSSVIEAILAKSNNYEQFTRYLELYNNRINETDVFTMIHQCNGYYLDYCSEEGVKYLNKTYRPLYEGKLDLSQPKLYRHKFKSHHKEKKTFPLLVDCEFDIVDTGRYSLVQYQTIDINHSVDTRSNNVINSASKSVINSDSSSHDRSRDGNNLLISIQFQIIQRNCQLQTDAKLSGGASFEINIENELNFVACSTIDLFNNRYEVRCLIPITPSELKVKKTCYDLNIMLDFEHYNAYSDVKLTPVKLRHHVAKSHNICRNLPTVPKQALKDTRNAAMSVITTDLFSTSTGFPGLIYDSKDNSWGVLSTSDVLTIHRSVEGFYVKETRNVSFQTKYKWEGKYGMFPRKNEFFSCIHNLGNVAMFGSSHTRSNFDHIVYSYVNDRLLVMMDRNREKTITFHEFDLTDTRFISQVAEEFSIGRIARMCLTKTSMIVVFMVGSWDLYQWSPRNFIRNKAYGPSLLKALHYLRDLGCNKFIRIICISTVPQVSSTVSWFNNYATAAAMQWFIRSLYDINYGNFHFVDAFNIVLPTVTGSHSDNVCNNHYLCHHAFEDHMIQTTAGKVVLSALVNAMCEANAFNRTKWISYDNIYPTGTVISHLDKMYLIWNGLKRFIPNNATMRCMNFSWNDVIHVDAKEFADIPIDTPLPNRKDRSVHQVGKNTDYIRTYLLDNCMKRNVQDLTELTKYYLGYELPSYGLQVDEYDLQDIPSGPDLSVVMGADLAKALDGKVITSTDSLGRIFLVQLGSKRLIPDMKTFYDLKFELNDIITISNAKMKSIRPRPPLISTK